MVPVVEYDIADDDEAAIDGIRIDENLRRRNLKPSETAHAIRRLYEIAGIKVGNNQTTASTTMVEAAKQIGYSPTATSRYNTLADLIAPLMALLDDGKITQALAYQFAQMEKEDQRRLDQRHHPVKTNKE